MKTGKKPHRLVILVLFSMLLSACGGDRQRLDLLAEDATVLAFGDSLTYGSGAGRDQSYPAVLSQLIGRTVVNAGVPGELSSAGRERLAGMLERHRPQLILLCHGGNDILRHQSPDRLRANLQAMIETARIAGAQVVLIAVPEFGLLLSPMPVYETVAEALDVPIESEVLSNVIAAADLKSDSVHPNAEGYRRVASALAELLKREGAL